MAQNRSCSSLPDWPTQQADGSAYISNPDVRIFCETEDSCRLRAQWQERVEREYAERELPFTFELQIRSRCDVPVSGIDFRGQATSLWSRDDTPYYSAGRTPSLYERLRMPGSTVGHPEIRRAFQSCQAAISTGTTTIIFQLDGSAYEMMEANNLVRDQFVVFAVVHEGQLTAWARDTKSVHDISTNQSGRRPFFYASRLDRFMVYGERTAITLDTLLSNDGIVLEFRGYTPPLTEESIDNETALGVSIHFDDISGSTLLNELATLRANAFDQIHSSQCQLAYDDAENIALPVQVPF